MALAAGRRSGVIASARAGTEEILDRCVRPVGQFTLHIRVGLINACLDASHGLETREYIGCRRPRRVDNHLRKTAELDAVLIDKRCERNRVAMPGFGQCKGGLGPAGLGDDGLQIAGKGGEGLGIDDTFRPYRSAHEYPGHNSKA